MQHWLQMGTPLRNLQLLATMTAQSGSFPHSLKLFQTSLAATLLSPRKPHYVSNKLFHCLLVWMWYHPSQDGNQIWGELYLITVG